jgi:hypothetical protein
MQDYPKDARSAMKQVPPRYEHCATLDIGRAGLALQNSTGLPQVNGP